MSELKHKIFQIFYDEASKQKLDPGFIPLDNTANPRPDWYEIWPILEYFNTHGIDDKTWYGFLSPRFREKTKYKSKKVYKWLNQYSSDFDVLVLSQRLKPRFTNVFEQGDITHPGLTRVTQLWLDEYDPGCDVIRLDTRNERAIFSNYFLARGSFWRLWLQFTLSLVQHAEDQQSPLSTALNNKTFYRRDTPPIAMKVFVAERIPSLILGLNPDLKAVARRPLLLKKLLPRAVRKLVEKPRHPFNT